MRPREGLRSGAGVTLNDCHDRTPNKAANEWLRDRADEPTPRSIDIDVAEEEPSWMTCYRPEGDTSGLRSGACNVTERPTEGETAAGFNAAIRDAARQLRG